MTIWPFLVNACGNEGATVAGLLRFGALASFFFFVEPWNVIVGNFFEGVEGHDVVDVELRTGAGFKPSAMP